jgi:circadian clock protein KaiC
VPERQVPFANALANALRDRGVTAIFLMEIDAFAGPELSTPVPNVSATMDNGILLRTAELRSELRRLVSVLKLRQSPFDRVIREFVIGASGIAVGEPLPATGLLTGSAVPDPAG